MALKSWTSGENVLTTDLNSNFSTLADGSNMGAGSIDTAELATNSVTAPKLATTAITIGYAEVTANQTGITTAVDLTGLSVTVTVPTGGRKVKITGQCLAQNDGTTGRTTFYIKESTTVLQQCTIKNSIAAINETMVASVILTPSSGSHTYKLTMEASSGTTQMSAGAEFPAFILVEVI